MTSRSSRLVGAITLVSCVAGRVSIVCAKGIELTPVSGYRFGWNLFETVAGQPIDLDGAPALGFVVDVPLSDGLQVEGLFTHQHARTPLWRVAIDHWQGGGLQEFTGGRPGPLLARTLWLTR